MQLYNIFQTNKQYITIDLALVFDVISTHTKIDKLIKYTVNINLINALSPHLLWLFMSILNLLWLDIYT